MLSARPFGYVDEYGIPQRRAYRVRGRVERVVASVSASNVDDASMLPSGFSPLPGPASPAVKMSFLFSLFSECWTR